MNSKTVLITGGTGNLGGRVMAELLLETDTTIKLIVYGKSQEEIEREVDKVFKFWECDPANRGRIESIQGDITLENLNIAPPKYYELSQSVTHIIHCAANFKIDLPIEEARKSILYGTQNVASLGLKCLANGQFKRMLYISTAEIGLPFKGEFKEEFISSDREFLNTYEKAKAEAEEYLQKEFKEKQLPITIIRPGMIVGDSKTGKILNPQAVYNIITQMFLKPPSKIMPRGDGFRIEAVPVDYLSKAIVLLSLAEESNGGVYHLTPNKEDSLDVNQFVKELQTVYQRITGKIIEPPKFIIPPGLYVGALNVLSLLTFGKVKKELEKQKAFAKFFFVSVRFDNSKTKQFMEKRGIEFPHIRDYLYTICNYFNKENPAIASLNA